MSTLAFLLGVICWSNAAAFDYCSISAQNSLCLYSTCTFSRNCTQPKPGTLTATQKLALLTTHDLFRRMIALGGLDLSVLGGPSQMPGATNMREMIWDDELATMAQAWAYQCIPTNDANRDVSRFTVGQNIAKIGKSSDSVVDEVLSEATDSWVQPSASFISVADVTSYSAGDAGAPFAQMIWANTYTMGCALTIYADSSPSTSLPYVYWLVCNYGPAGAVAGQPIYLTGNAATACPNGTIPEETLCILP